MSNLLIIPMAAHILLAALLCATLTAGRAHGQRASTAARAGRIRLLRSKRG
jgi:hypothetical protein